MSDIKTPVLNENELRQVTGGISANIQQPANAARYLNQLITYLNSAIVTIESLSERIAFLEALADSESTSKPAKTSKKPPASIDSSI